MFNFNFNFNELPTYKVRFEIEQYGSKQISSGIMLKEMAISQYLDMLSQIIALSERNPTPMAVTMFVEKDVYDHKGDYLKTITNSVTSANKYYKFSD